MQITVERYAFVKNEPSPQYPIKETLTFIVAGTEGIAVDDPRIFELDGQDVVFSGTGNPLYAMPELPHTKRPQKRINPETRGVEVIQVNDQPIRGQDYDNSPFWNPFNIPIKGTFQEIDEDTYWDMMSAYLTHHNS